MRASARKYLASIWQGGNGPRTSGHLRGTRTWIGDVNSTFLSLARVIVPVSIAVELLSRLGVIEHVAPLLRPLMGVFGLPPEMVFAGIIIVLGYQTWIHTELIGKLGPLEGVLNTPANHRVHHGCDDKYIDKNYGGILIIWDRLFGTYQREEETPRYGLKRDYDSVNPLSVWFSEWPGLFSDVKKSKTLGDTLMYIFGRPGWQPKQQAPSKVLLEHGQNG